jgi:hypothetical protein
MIVVNPTPSNRLVLLGASNLTKSIALILHTARATLGMGATESLDVRLAYGHGRSYGINSSILGRTLPGIATCGLWDDLDAASDAPTWALLTDFGNDVMYGVEPETIIDWAESCVVRLHARNATVALTALPLERVRSLRRWEFRVMRRLLFPANRATFEHTMERVERLDALLVDLASRSEITLVRPRRDWYGLDPIHIRHLHRRAAWREIIGAWRPDASPPLTRGSLRHTMAIRTTTPQRWWFRGRERGRPQPSRTLSNKTSVAMY